MYPPPTIDAKKIKVIIFLSFTSCIMKPHMGSNVVHTRSKTLMKSSRHVLLLMLILWNSMQSLYDCPNINRCSILISYISIGNTLCFVVSMNIS